MQITSSIAVRSRPCWVVRITAQVQTLFIDDLDGSEANGTVRFGLDGTEYEIDLNAQHAQQLRDALARYWPLAAESVPPPDGQLAADAKYSRTL